MKVESPYFLVPSDEWNGLGIAIRYQRCCIIDGRLFHGTKCECHPRDNFLFVLNRQGAQE